MDNLYIEAYKFYKNDYAHGLVLFHIQSHFEAYEDDAIQLGAVLNGTETAAFSIISLTLRKSMP